MEISVLQWNVWSQEDIRHIAEFLKKHPADVICLQELTVDHPKQEIKVTPAYVAEQLGYNYAKKELPIETTDGQKIMLANGIFSRFPIKAQRWAWINEPRAGGGYSDEYRAYVEATLDTGSQLVTVGTTHMSYTHKFEVTPAKQAETDLLTVELAKHQNNFIFTGDLNALPGSYTINAIAKLLSNAGPDLEQKTWTTKPFSYNGFEATTLDWRLDYVFTSEDIRVTSSEILSTEVSDHLPVLTKFVLAH